MRKQILKISGRIIGLSLVLAICLSATHLITSGGLQSGLVLLTLTAGLAILATWYTR